MEAEEILARPVVQVTTEVVRLVALLGELFSESHQHTGLSRIELSVLIGVAAAPVAPTVPQIGRAIGHARQVIQKAANRLVAEGLIETAQNPHHKRASLLKITPAGKALTEDVFQRGATIADRIFAQIDSERWLRLAGDLQSLRLELEVKSAAAPGSDADWTGFTLLRTA